MKILNSQQIKDVDKCSIISQNISSWDLMERASSVFVEKLLNYIHHQNIVHIFCGKGNNGGDGLAIARMLIQKGFQVQVMIVEHSENASQDFSINLNKLQSIKSNILYLNCLNDLNDIEINENSICIDAILGSGVNKPTHGIIKECIEFINQNYKKIFSVDVPSGLFLDSLNHSNDTIIKAHHTFTFQLPKLSFLFPENATFTGKWEILDIGLSEECIAQHPTTHFAIDKELIQNLYQPRNNISAKWNYGHCLIIAGSNTMRGAAMMCVASALRSGCGLVSIHSIEKVISQVSQNYPECLLSIDTNENECAHLPENLNKYNAIAFGSGMGISKKVANLLKQLLIQLDNKKLIVDADGLNVLSLHPEYWDLIPPNQVIITPHIKEFERLFGQFSTHFDRLNKAREIAQSKKIVIVLKSPYTSIVTSKGEIYFNIIANSGLAKGGSGDVLTGLIAGLCARGYDIEKAALLGVYIHSIAGKLALQKIHPECLLPTDLIPFYSEVFNSIHNA